MKGCFSNDEDGSDSNVIHVLVSEENITLHITVTYSV
jgi:hypothetical protein